MDVSWITFGAPIRRPDGAITSDLASMRYRVLLPVAAMQGRGFKHQLIQMTAKTPPDVWDRALKCDVMVFSKSFLPANEALAQMAKARGVRVVFDVCDNHYQHPQYGAHYRAMSSIADQVVANTPAMAAVAAPFSGAPPVVIEDPYEGKPGEPAFAPGERLKLLWFGHQSNLDSLRAATADLAGYARGRPVDLILMTKPVEGLVALCEQTTAESGGALSVTFAPWSLEAQWEALAACDAVIIPSLQTDEKQVKSANRMIEALWAGRPVVAHPMPAYLPFAAWTPIRETLSEGLGWLVANQDKVPGMIAAAQAEIETRFSPAALSQQWEALIQSLQPDRPPAGPAAAPVRLNLGCGDKILEGFVNVDVVEARAGKKPDVICDLHKLTPFEDASADEVMAIHVVEHFWRWEVVDVLKEWVRVLKPGGKMILECPNLISACEAVLADPAQATGPGQEGQRSMWVLYGDPRWQDPLMTHRWAYTPQSLAAVMHEAGLRDLRQEPAQYKLREPRDMRITGVKPA